MHDLHATMLALLGLDHEKLVYLFEGRNRRLTDVGRSERAPPPGWWRPDLKPHTSAATRGWSVAARARVAKMLLGEWASTGRSGALNDTDGQRHGGMILGAIVALGAAGTEWPARSGSKCPSRGGARSTSELVDRLGRERRGFRPLGRRGPWNCPSPGCREVDPHHADEHARAWQPRPDRGRQARGGP
ncbi:MAG: DUF1501 domain-containing protein [Isosphaeraceae bacterium]